MTGVADDIPAEMATLLAGVVRLRLAGYQARYRVAVQAILVEVRDTHRKGSPEWAALETALLKIGAAPRDPLSVPADLDEPSSAPAAPNAVRSPPADQARLL
ncbi:hypothetical protein GAY33_05170 [Azospirillum brasilense]|uniref:hypothetical protein n=1 Tax=Azospirillum argentinense TaxID=2970906 RepID=UPI00190BFBFB|nr:hypothetical protein [Azospirillum argentinense]MBK3798627.1 hypothetical protein [Azospirillum argentinense]